MPRSKPEVKFAPASDLQDAYIWNTRRESMLDGGVGNGKTTGGLMRLIILAREFPGSRFVVARQTYKTLMKTTRVTFDKFCPKSWIARDVKEDFRFTNGSEILWLHLDELSDSDLRSLEINGAFVSQAEEIAPEMWDFLDSRVGRWYKDEWREPCPAYTWGECNPNGHDWIYFRFHPEVVGGDLNYYSQNKKSFSSLTDKKAYYFGETAINKRMLDINSPGYYEMLMNKPEAWKRRWVYGSRDVFEGAIHPEFSRNVHVYNPRFWNPFERMDIKSCWGWMDYGLSAPTCVLFSASTSNNFHFITNAYYAQAKTGKTITIREHAAEITRLMNKNSHPIRGIWADPSVFHEDTRDRKVRSTSVAQEFRENGLYLQRADNNEPTSIDNLNDMFRVDPELRNPVTNKPGSPHIFISQQCEELIEQIQLQRHSETRNPLTGDKEFTEERMIGIPDHAYDPLRYFANSPVWQPIRYRKQPTIPQYRTGPYAPPPVGGYQNVGQQMKRNNSWRDLPPCPEPPRVNQGR